MANQNDYIVNVKAKGAKKTQQQLKGVNSSLTSMAGKVTGVAAAYFGTQGLINAASAATEAFARQEQAEKSLEFALGSNTQALLNQASALQKVTTFGDEAIIEQQAFLASLKFSEDQIKSIIPVALDLAEATGISLESAVRNTSKTFSGLAGELGELVPQLRDLTQEEMKAGKAVEVMADLFQGQAQAGAETFGGQLQQLSNTMGDLSEVLGQKLNEKLGFLVPLLKEGAEALIDFLTPPDLQTMEGLNKHLKDLNAELEKEQKLLNGLQSDAIRKQEIELIKEQIAFTEIEIEKRRARLEQLDDEQAKLENLFESQSAPLENLRKITDDHFNKQAEGFKKVNQGIMGELTLRKRLALFVKNNQSEELKQAALNGKSVIRNEIMEGTSGLISSILKSVPYPFNLLLAAGAGTAVQGLVDKQLSKFESGGLVGGRRHSQGGTIIEAEQGEFVMSRDAVSRIGINNLNAMNQGASGTTINISAPLLDDTIVDSIIPKIEEAVRRGSDLGV